MTRIVKVFCYLCWQNGEMCMATHKYFAKDGCWYDVCNKHTELCKMDGRLLEKLNVDEDGIMEIAQTNYD